MSSSRPTSRCCRNAALSSRRCRACCASSRSTAPRCSPRRWSRSARTWKPRRASKNQAEALDALMRAMVQLPSYLDRVLAGGRDMALVLLPLLNDLRAVRGSPLLSEGTLLLAEPEVRPAGRAAAAEPARSAPRAGRRRASRARASSSALIGWIRGERVDHHLENLAAWPASRSSRAGRDQHAAAVPAVVGRGRRHRGAARSRPGGSVSSSACLALRTARSSACTSTARRISRSIRRSNC
jgi:hypothetical protein